MSFVEILFIVIAVAGYFVPSIIARKKSHFKKVLLLNIFAGWTLIGWVAALIWSLNGK